MTSAFKGGPVGADPQKHGAAVCGGAIVRENRVDGPSLARAVKPRKPVFPAGNHTLGRMRIWQS